MSSITNSQFDQGLSNIDWMQYPQLMQKVVSAFMVQTTDMLNKLREVLSLAQRETSAAQLQCGFNAASSMQTSGLVQSGIGGMTVAGGGWQTKAAFETAGKTKMLTAEFQENDSSIDSQLRSSNTFIEPVPAMNAAMEEGEGITIRVQQVDATPEIPVSQERVDEDALRSQKESLRHKHDNDHRNIQNTYQKHYGIGQAISGLGGLLHMIDGGAQAQKVSNDAANASFEHNYQTQETTRSSVNQTADKVLIDMYAVNVASTRG